MKAQKTSSLKTAKLTWYPLKIQESETPPVASLLERELDRMKHQDFDPRNACPFRKNRTANWAASIWSVQHCHNQEVLVDLDPTRTFLRFFPQACAGFSTESGRQPQKWSNHTMVMTHIKNDIQRLLTFDLEPVLTPKESP